MLILLKIAILGVKISKIFRGRMPLHPPKWLVLSALAKLLHDRTHEPGFATEVNVVHHKLKNGKGTVRDVRVKPIFAKIQNVLY